MGCFCVDFDTDSDTLTPSVIQCNLPGMINIDRLRKKYVLIMRDIFYTFIQNCFYQKLMVSYM